MSDSHPKCHGPQGHVCQEPSGRDCIDCGKAAGTLWGPYWCPDCDVKRLDKISASLHGIAASIGTTGAQ
jgi:hypothetical protein